MEIFNFPALLLCGLIGGTTCSTFTPAAELSIDDTVIFLKKKWTQTEARLSSLENKDTSDLIQALKDELLVAERLVQDAEKRSVEERNKLVAKIEDMESRTRGLDFEASLDELRQWTLKQKEDIRKEFSVQLQEMARTTVEYKDDVLKKVAEAEKGCSESIEDILGKLREVSSDLGRQRTETQILQIKIDETNALYSEAGIRNNISLSAEKLRQEFNESLTSGLEKVRSNLTKKMRIFEDSLSKFERDYASVSYVSTLDETLKNLERMTENEFQTLKSAIMKFETCDDEPPFIPNGKPLDFKRKHGSNVRYECDRNFAMTGKSTVHCKSGKWEGQPPVCSFFDNDFTLSTFINLNVTCYSDDNYQRIQFTRMIDDGLGESLPMNVFTLAKHKAAVLDFHQLEQLDGAFKCKFSVSQGSMELAVLLQDPQGDPTVREVSKVANVGDKVDLGVIPQKVTFLPLKWRFNGVLVPSWSGKWKVEIPNVQPTDAGIYETYYEGYRSKSHAFQRLIVRKCKANLYGERCDQKCPTCYNGGICHDHLGVCVCPPGFVGNNCEVVCGENLFGADCTKACPGGNCAWSTFCRPDPYGCSCAPGFEGYWCGLPCGPGWYGAGCKEPCHCADGPESCNPYTGSCSGGCSSGWTGDSCQIPVVN